MTKNRQRIDWLVLSMFLNLNYNQFNQTDPDGIKIFFWVKTLANFWRCQLFPKINTIVIYCLSLTILKVSFNQVCFFIVCTLQILVLHGQIVTPHDPTSEPPDSQYVLFSAMVEPQLSETENRRWYDRCPIMSVRLWNLKEGGS